MKKRLLIVLFCTISVLSVMGCDFGASGNTIPSGPQLLPIDYTSQISLNTDETIIDGGINEYFAILLTSESRLFAWGYNIEGQLGTGNNTKINSPTDVTSHISLNTGETITNISIGACSKHTMLLTSEYRVLTYGYNHHGQLGDGSIDNQNSAMDITANFNLNANEHIISIFSGGDTSSAVSSEGRVFVWGRNEESQVGNGTNIDQSLPQDITSNFTFNTNEVISAIEHGLSHTHAITNQGRLFAWGVTSYNYRQFGDPSITNGSGVPVDITDSFQLSTGEEFTTIRAGWVFASMITSDGRYFSCGFNNYGQLGDGIKALDKIAYPIDISANFNLASGEQIAHVKVGEAHTLVVTNMNRVFTWGHGIEGQLDNSLTDDEAYPQDITGNLNLNAGEEITLILVGNAMNLVITSNNRIIMWGTDVI